MIQPTHFDEKRHVISSRNHSMDALLAGNVCTHCNNGWMADLEAKCKPLLLKLAAGDRRILELTDSEALLLSRWTVKTCFALHFSANWRRVVPVEHVYVLDSDTYRLPERVYVVGHTYKGSKDISWSQSTTWPLLVSNREISEEEVLLARTDGYKIGLMIGGLFVMVFYNPLPQAIPCLWKRRHIPLYPRWSHPVFWQTTDMPWPKKANVRFHYFVQELALTVDGF
jgi:hypothetical protein